VFYSTRLIVVGNGEMLLRIEYGSSVSTTSCFLEEEEKVLPAEQLVSYDARELRVTTCVAREKF
jgi:hypothetical protein